MSGSFKVKKSIMDLYLEKMNNFPSNNNTTSSLTQLINNDNVPIKKYTDLIRERDAQIFK